MRIKFHASFKCLQLAKKTRDDYGFFRLFMLTHGKEVREVSFSLITFKALSCAALRLVL